MIKSEKLQNNTVTSLPIIFHIMKYYAIGNGGHSRSNHPTRRFSQSWRSNSDRDDWSSKQDPHNPQTVPNQDHNTHPNQPEKNLVETNPKPPPSTGQTGQTGQTGHTGQRISVVAGGKNGAPNGQLGNPNAHHGSAKHNGSGGQYCVCCNCGGFGHMYRNCNQPITSYGCIVYRWNGAREAGAQSSPPRQLQYLMVQRRDSLAYVEFLRGKYRLDNTRYILQLLRGMTREELTRLVKLSFDELWMRLWTGASRNFVKEQIESDAKLNHLKNGYIISGRESRKERVTLQSLISLISDMDCLPETEWGFPKGRRNLMESDKACAIREFREETGIRPIDIRIRGSKPMDEVFTGSNGVRYRHVYYVAEYVGGEGAGASQRSSQQDAFDAFESNEIKAVKWMTFDEVMSKFSHRDCNVEKRELLKRVDGLVMCRYVKEKDTLALPVLVPKAVDADGISSIRDTTTGCWRRAKAQRNLEACPQEDIANIS